MGNSHNSMWNLVLSEEEAITGFPCFHLTKHALLGQYQVGHSRPSRLPPSVSVLAQCSVLSSIHSSHCRKGPAPTWAHPCSPLVPCRPPSTPRWSLITLACLQKSCQIGLPRISWRLSFPTLPSLSGVTIHLWLVWSRTGSVLRSASPSLYSPCFSSGLLYILQLNLGF